MGMFNLTSYLNVHNAVPKAKTLNEINDALRIANIKAIELDKKCYHKSVYSNPFRKEARRLRLMKHFLEFGIENIEPTTIGLKVNNKYLLGWKKNKWKVIGNNKWYYYQSVPHFIGKFMFGKEIIEVIPSKESIEEATKMAEEMGTLKNSITEGDGNVAGFLGEVLVRKLLKAEQKNTYDYDLVLKDGKTVDVKTKRTKVKPRLSYECSVAKLNTRQKCDYYAFIRITKTMSRAWFIGLIPKNTYFSNSKFMKKGEVDEDNDFTVKSDCYNMSIDNVLAYSEHKKYR